jgi:pYEATS domain-containing protein involved in immunity
MQAEVLTCLNSELSFDVANEKIVSGKADSCLRRVTGLDAAVRDQAVAIVASAVSRASSESVLKDQAVWHSCYERIMTPQARDQTLNSKYAAANIEIRSTASPLASTEVRPERLFEWRIWVAGIDEMLPDLTEIYYSFDHPSFDGHIEQSTRASNSFQIRYRGWGCVSKVTATLVFKDSSRLAKSFDQCSVMPRGTPGKGGGRASFRGDAGAADLRRGPRKCAPGEVPPPIYAQQERCIP